MCQWKRLLAETQFFSMCVYLSICFRARNENYSIISRTSTIKNEIQLNNVFIKIEYCAIVVFICIQNGAIKGNKQTNQKTINIYINTRKRTYKATIAFSKCTWVRNRAVLRLDLESNEYWKKNVRQNALSVPWRCKQKIANSIYRGWCLTVNLYN